jgi:predicted lysophospholipase L1 biosynthesis ABC-type transport system permease subunit
VLTAGRAPEGSDEVALGPATARDLDVSIGEAVEVGDDAVPMTVVGEALFPADVHAAFDEGAWLAEPGFDAVAPPVDVESGTGPGRLVAVRFAEGVDPDDGLAALQAAVGDRSSEVSPVEVPLELENLANVRTLPTVLAVFLALLAVAAVGHVLLTSARRRRQTFAVLRALGLSRRSSRWVLNSQGTTIGLVGLLVGIPVGVVIGRWGWSTVADDVPLVQVTPSAPLAVAIVVPAALLVANALALWPGRRVARMRPADILRSE